MQKTIIATDNAPKAIGAYNQAVAVKDAKLLFISGQIGLNPQTMKMVEGGVSAEAKQVLENLGGILKQAGGNYSSVIKATLFLADINDFATVNEIYASYFENNPPARAAFAVAALPLGARVEIEAIAAL
jgi:2-iminobutanoate/2-iminopropanoate deaminase